MSEPCDVRPIRTGCAVVFERFEQKLDRITVNQENHLNEHRLQAQFHRRIIGGFMVPVILVLATTGVAWVWNFWAWLLG